MSTDRPAMLPHVSTLRDLIDRHQVLAFLTTTLVISWSFWAAATVLVGGSGLSRGLLIPGAFGPPIAAIVVTWASDNSVRDWLAHLARWRVSPRWYAAVIGLPAVATFLGVGGALVLTGRPFDPGVIPGRLPLVAITFLIASLVGGGQEELGWRGFLLPRLQARYGALGASLLIGVIWALWHFPLFLLEAPRNESGSFLLYSLLVIGLSVLFTWAYNSTSGSILVAIGLHAGFNASGMFIPAPFEVLSAVPLAADIGMIVGVWLVALVIVVSRDTATLSQSGYPKWTRQFIPTEPNTDPATEATDGW